MTGYFLLFFGLLLLFALIGSTSLRDDPDASWFDVFALDRYEWYGALKADVRTSLRQLGRDRDRLFRFVSNNFAWVFATATGMIGLILTGLMMFGMIPTSMKTAVAQTLHTDPNTIQVDQPKLIETRTSIPDYVFTANDPSVAMEVKGLVYRREVPKTRFDEPQPNGVIAAAGMEEVRAKEPVEFSRSVRVFSRLPGESDAVADDDRELVVVAQPVARPRNAELPKQHDLIDEVVTGDVRRRNNRIDTQVGGLHVEKVYPESTALGKPVLYEIILQNKSDRTIGRVRVEETIPEPAGFLNTVPQAEQSTDDRRQVWIVDRLAPDEIQTILIELDPRELDSVATNTRVLVRAAYSDSADAVVDNTESKKVDPVIKSSSEPKPDSEPQVVRSRRKSAAQPSKPNAETIGRVRVEITGPKRARVGDQFALRFRLYNYGTEPIDNAVIRVRTDERIRGDVGGAWRVAVTPPLKPGQSRMATFRGKTVKVGAAVTRIDVLFGNKVVQSGKRRLEIVADDRK